MTHQMWHDHSFSQRNKITEISVVVVVGDREGGGLGNMSYLKKILFSVQ